MSEMRIGKLKFEPIGSLFYCLTERISSNSRNELIGSDVEPEMKKITLAAPLALVALMGLGTPAFAIGFTVNLPSLTWPEQPAPSVTRGCADHNAPTVTTACEANK